METRLLNILILISAQIILNCDFMTKLRLKDTIQPYLLFELIKLQKILTISRTTILGIKKMCKHNCLIIIK